MDLRTHTPEMTMPELLDCLDLACVGDPAAPTSRWEGRPQPHPSDRMFGGLLLAQAIVAGGRTVPVGQQALSLQADFVRAVPPERPLRWEVTHVSDATSLSTRRARLLDDDGRELFSAMTLWGEVRDDLPSSSSAQHWPSPPPEDLLDLEDRFPGDIRVPLWWRMSRPVRVRHAVTPPYTELGPRTDRVTAHLRTKGPLPDDRVLRAAVVAYVSDMCLIEPAFTTAKAIRHAPGSRILSLTHALTFHADVHLDAWHQYDCRVATVAHGRAHGTGELFDGDGRHVASASQLALVRLGAMPSA
ncbi:acyl-CoA thioesterase [Kribbia dieselivorans]|uniref:acyl-CoA thioesterase n=1 Tax=Kribbia dieselivorans TaxID=331526 RepID=UPI0014707B14|nr:acyl-CoA thioesterase domain-containing protein [Kribbia dieselivorans]